MAWQPVLGPEHCQGIDCILADYLTVKEALERFKAAGVSVDDFLEDWERCYVMATKLKANFFPHNP